jgi:hypothetical protein
MRLVFVSSDYGERSSGTKTTRQENRMLSAKSAFIFALLVPFFWTALPAEAQKKKDVDAIRADCFRQANEAVSGLKFPSTSEKQEKGTSVYRRCAQKNGIRP